MVRRPKNVTGNRTKGYCNRPGYTILVKGLTFP